MNETESELLKNEPPATAEETRAVKRAIAENPLLKREAVLVARLQTVLGIEADGIWGANSERALKARSDVWAAVGPELRDHITEARKPWGL